jgi:hypothetical protein
MPTETYEFVYAVVPIGASGNFKINATGTSTSGGVTFSDADNTMTAGNTFTYNSTTYTFSGSGGSTTGFFATSGGTTYFFSHSAIAANTNVGAINASGSELITCFTAGTLIMTERGEVPVEQLKAGDMVRTASGELRPVKWLGVQPISLMFMSRDRSMPVRIAAGALGAMQPARDLVVSPGHAVLVDGVLCNASALINGTTITRAVQDANFSYYHVELDSHDLLISEGLASESYLCTMDRNMYANAKDYERAHGADTAPSMPMALPRATVQSQLPQTVRSRLFNRRAA